MNGSRPRIYSSAPTADVNQQQAEAISSSLPAGRPDGPPATMSRSALLGGLLLGFCLSVNGHADKSTTGKRDVLQLNGGNFARALREHHQLLVHFREFPPCGLV